MLMWMFFKLQMHTCTQLYIRWVWMYERENQNPQIDEGQTTQWPKDKRTNNTMTKRQKDKQRSTKHKHQTSNTIPVETGGELWCSGRVSSTCSTSFNRCVNLVKKSGDDSVLFCLMDGVIGLTCWLVHIRVV